MQKLQEHRWLRSLFMWGVLHIILHLCDSLPLPIIPRTITQGILLVGVFFFLDNRYFHIFPQLYCKKVPFVQQLGAVIPLIVYMIFFNVTNLSAIHTKNIGAALIVGLEAAIMEEYLCRGLLLGGLLKDSRKRLLDIWLAVIASSFIFGLAHLQNIAHQSLEYTLFQIASATLIGIFYGAIYTRTQSLIWVMIGHFIQDFVVIGINGTTTPSTPDKVWVAMLVLALIILPSAIWLLRPKKQADIASGFSR